MKSKLILVLILLVVLVIVYGLTSRIYGALKAGDRLTQALDRLHQVEIKNKALQAQLNQATTPDFIEQQARNKLMFAKEGETVVVIAQSKIEAVLGASKQAVEERLPNWLGWLKVFWH